LSIVQEKEKIIDYEKEAFFIECDDCEKEMIKNADSKKE